MEGKHTKGPWILRESPATQDGGFWRHPYWIDGENNEPVADVRGVTNVEANAHLIAAAPEMLELIEKMWCEGGRKWGAD